MKLPCVYLLASRRNGTLYVGVTSDLVKRVWQHKKDGFDGFTKRYRVHTLVWYEVCDSMIAAIAREKAIKETCMENQVDRRSKSKMARFVRSIAVTRSASCLCPIEGARQVLSVIQGKPYRANCKLATG